MDEAVEPAWQVREVVSAVSQLGLERPAVLAALTRLIESYGGRSYSTRYVDLLAGDWLDNFLHVLYAAWCVPDNGRLPFVPAAIAVSATARNFLHVSMQDAGFHASVLAAVRRLRGHGEIKTAPIFARTTIAHVERTRPSVAKRLLGRGGRSGAPVLIASPYFRCTNAQWLMALAKWGRLTRWDDLNPDVAWTRSVDVAWRGRASADIGHVETFRDCALAMLPLLMPVNLLEGFEATRTQLLAARIPRPRAVYTANALLGHTSFKLLMAEWADQGTRILNHQHGGGYGLDRVHSLEDYEIGVADRFFTWGWSDCARPTIEPLSPTNMPFARGDRSGVLLCCVEFPPCVYRLQLHPMPGAPIDNMRRETIAFIVGMAEPSQLTVRPHPNSYGAQFVASLRTSAPQAMLAQPTRQPYDQFASSALVVHGYLGTSWLETLALDIPTICFYNESTYAFRDAALPYIQRLIDAGILHHSGAAAARFVNGLAGAPDRWWRRPDVQQARNAFVSEYARFSPAWHGEWRRAFESVVESRE